MSRCKETKGILKQHEPVWPGSPLRHGRGRQNLFGPILGVGEFTTHFRTYLSGCWGYGFLTQAHIFSARPAKGPQKRKPKIRLIARRRGF